MMTLRIVTTSAAATVLLLACGDVEPLARISVKASDDGRNGNGDDDSNARGFRLRARARLHEERRNKKVAICHVPPGNPANVRRISVSKNAVAQHVRRHGDGVCADGASDCCALPQGGSVCTSLRSDREHCGACGARCAPGQVCSASVCISSGSRKHDGAHDGGAQTGAHDGGARHGSDDEDGGVEDGGARHGSDDEDGGVEDGGEVTTPSDAGAPTPHDGGGPSTCVPGTTFCDDACVDLETDRHHCGECGFRCGPASPGCEFGTCGRPPCQADSDCLRGETCMPNGDCVAS